jgi:hypothetical protein
MFAQKKLRPGQPGTKQLLEQYGDRLWAVRYRCDPETRRTIKTIELIVEEREYQRRRQRLKPEQMVGVRINYQESALQHAARAVGAKWNPATRLWEMRYADAEHLRLTERIVKPGLSNTGKSKIANNGK